MKLNPFCLVASLFATVLCFGHPAVCEETAHWSYRPVRHPPVPVAQRDDPSKTPLDRFVINTLRNAESHRLRNIDRTALIRRVSLDLIGLPPTPEEVVAFVNDTSPNAYERLVDRLLASPHYGEHWARPWLDLCHYADTDGYLTDQARPVAWRYRAWLVEAAESRDAV